MQPLDPFVLRFLLLGQYPRGDLGGLSLNVLVAIVAFWLSLPAAVVLGVARSSPHRVIRWTAGTCVELVRATPLVMIVFWMYFCLPMLFGWDMSNLLCAVLSITIYAAAYEAEIIRGGLQAVSTSELEAAAVLGMTSWQCLWWIRLPQACRKMLPCFLSFFVSLLKDTSVLFIVGLTDVLQVGVIYSEEHPSRLLVIYLCVGVLFFTVCFVLSRIVGQFERRVMTQNCDACLGNGLVLEASRAG